MLIIKKNIPPILGNICGKIYTVYTFDFFGNGKTPTSNEEFRLTKLPVPLSLETKQDYVCNVHLKKWRYNLWLV